MVLKNAEPQTDSVNPVQQNPENYIPVLDLVNLINIDSDHSYSPES